MIFLNYYYDITLNFDMENIWEFYEWEEDDCFSYIKKIPLYRVSFETLKDFMTYSIKVDESFVLKNAHQTEIKGKDEIYASFLISDTKNSLAVMLNEEGNVIALSKTLVEDDNNINEFMYTITEVKIPYQKLEKRKIRKSLRQEEKVKNLILVELNTLLSEQKKEKLKYLYYEWFLKEEEDIHEMYAEMVEQLKKPINETLSRIYYLIRLSYHQV